MATVEFHMETSRRFITQAEAELRAGDEMQACEKAWGAVAHAMKAVAERHRWRHETHADLFRVVDNIVRLTGDPEIRLFFNNANALHKNFYEGRMGYEHIARSMERVKRLLTKLDAFMDADNNGAGG